jgi:sulfide:quinone oxidoreductase
MSRHIVIAGGGIAGLETLLALRDLAGDRVEITLVSSQPDFEVKPLRTAEPFSVDHVRHYDLAEVCRKHGVAFVQDAVTSVAPEQRMLNVEQGEPLSYDALVLALGTHAHPPFPRALRPTC